MCYYPDQATASEGIVFGCVCMSEVSVCDPFVSRSVCRKDILAATLARMEVPVRFR